MSPGDVLADHPWLYAVFAAVVGVFVGVGVSVARFVVRRRRLQEIAHMDGEEQQETQGSQEQNPWQSFKTMLANLNRDRDAVMAQLVHNKDVFFLRLTLTRAVIVAALATLTVGCDLAALTWTVLLHARLGDMQVNMLGDPEKIFVDTCMRDFEGLEVDSSKYQQQRRRCIDKLTKADRTAWLPRIRPTVDERVCGPEQLCDAGDGACLDRGTPRGASFRPGKVSQCYALIDRAKAERVAATREALLADVERRCTGHKVWEDYSGSARLEYCMRKHLSSGVCMNSVRTNCPADDDVCCPVAQNQAAAGGGTEVSRPNQYVCQKSPLVGLYCGHKDFKVPADAAEAAGTMCRDVTCDTFAWCRDFADVPGQCAGLPCQAYHRSVDLVIAMIVLLSLGILADLSDAVMMLRFPHRLRLKSAINASGGCLKLVAYFLVSAGGVHDFVAAAVAHACFNAAGNARVAEAKDCADYACLFLLMAMAGSLLASPLSARWGGRLVTVPHAKSRYDTA